MTMELHDICAQVHQKFFREQHPTGVTYDADFCDDGGVYFSVYNFETGRGRSSFKLFVSFDAEDDEWETHMLEFVGDGDGFLSPGETGGYQHNERRYFSTAEIADEITNFLRSVVWERYTPPLVQVYV